MESLFGDRDNENGSYFKEISIPEDEDIESEDRSSKYNSKISGKSKQVIIYS